MRSPEAGDGHGTPSAAQRLYGLGQMFKDEAQEDMIE